MSELRKIALLGSPGGGKTIFGLSAPGVCQNVWGSNEATSALNFNDRTDILPAVKFDWWDTLSPEEKAKFTDEKVSEGDVSLLIQKARARNIIKYRRYLYGLKGEMSENKVLLRKSTSGKEIEFKPEDVGGGKTGYPKLTQFIDNGTPFAQDFEDYVRVVFGNEFETKEGNFNSIAFAIKYKNEMTDFLRMIIDLPCNVIMTFHIYMTLDEATAAKADFMKDTAKGVKYPKEWQPLIMGQAKYILPGLFDWVIYMWTKENPGQANQYLAKLEADDATVGIAKSRVQPFENPREISFPFKHGFEFFDNAIAGYLSTGKLSKSK